MAVFWESGALDAISDASRSRSKFLSLNFCPFWERPSLAVAESCSAKPCRFSQVSACVRGSERRAELLSLRACGYSYHRSY